MSAEESLFELACQDMPVSGDEAREAMEAFKREHAHELAEKIRAAYAADNGQMYCADMLAAALLPVVEAHAAEETAQVRFERDRLDAEAKRFDKQWDRLATDRDRLASEVVNLQDELLRTQSAARFDRETERQRAEDAEAHRDRLAAEVERLRAALDNTGEAP